MIPCPGCGAGLRFDIASQAMRCDYCDSTYDPYRFDAEKGDATQAQDFDTYVWVCPACGGKLETPDQTDAMGFCPYCGGASLLFDRIRKQWRPAGVIPFQITKEQCKKAYLKEARRHLFVSRKYKDPQLLETFRGIYMPYWSYRIRHKGTYEIASETREHRKGDYMVSKVFKTSGEIDMEYDGYGHDASAAFDDRLSEDLSPFDPKDKKPFAPGFLSGFYTVIGDEPRGNFDEKVKDYAKQTTLEKLTARGTPVRKSLASKGARKVLPGSSYVPTSILGAERTLYPVWFMSYRQGDRVTYAAVNGQTGKVSADFPASPWRLLVFALFLAAAVFSLLIFGPSIKAGVAALLVSAVFFLGHLFLRRSFKNLTSQSRELRVSPEAVRYRKRETLRLFGAVLALAGGLGLCAADLPNNLIPYGYCVFVAALFFFYIYGFIRFQLDVAKRRPPQMDRKGAASDEK